MSTKTIFIVEAGIPIPKRRARGEERNGLQKALRNLPVGGSIFCPGAKSSNGKIRPGCAGEFTARQVTEGSISGIRIWRIRTAAEAAAAKGRSQAEAA